MNRTKTPLFLASAVALAAIFNGASPAQQSSIKELKEREKKVKEVVRKTMPATVAIDGVRNAASGSGVIVSEDGLILTAAHVTDAAGELLIVTFPDGSTARAKSLGANSSRDAGMAQITDEGDWPFVKRASPESVELGEWVVALGHPGGYEARRTPPVRLGRVWTKGFLRMLGTDCTLVGGDSGGPLFDLDGKLIGIHSSIGGRLSENRHVPMDAFNDDWEAMLAGEKWGSQGVMMGRVDPNRPALGVQLDRESTDGVRVAGLSEFSPAGDAGVEVGDVIRRIGNKKIADYDALVKRLERLKAGQKINVVVQRGDEEVEIEVKLTKLGRLLDRRSGERAEPQVEPEPSADRATLGVQLERDAEGAKIYEVLPGSPAAKAGLKDGDVVIEIGGEEVESSAGVAEALGGQSPGDEISIKIRRGDEELTKKVTLGRFGDRAPDGQLNREEKSSRGRPSLGVQLERDAQGAKVFEVVPDSAAAEAGLESGDWVIEIEGEPIANAAEMAENIAGRSPGDEISLKVRRGDREMEMKVTLGVAGQ